MGVSLLIARFVTSQQTAMLLVLLIFFVPGFFISGLILPHNDSSMLTRLISLHLPATHFMAIARGLFLKGLGLASLAPASRHPRGLGLITLAAACCCSANGS